MKKQKEISTLIGTIIIIIATVILFGGSFIYQYFALRNYVQNQAVSVSSLLKNQNQQIAGWKTYKNSEHGFEIKYPEELLFNEPSIAKGSCTVSDCVLPDHPIDNGAVVNVEKVILDGKTFSKAG